jgi:HTH-type transcriptional regulator / antitoxin HigA
MEKVMSATLLDTQEYGRLLAETLPVTIHTDAEHKRLLKAVEQLMERPEEELTPEEGRLLEMLGMLIEDYEDRRYPFPAGSPHKMLADLLGERGMKPSDLWNTLPKSRVSEILSGKRGISKSQAKQLAELFRVPADLFL